MAKGGKGGTGKPPAFDFTAQTLNAVQSAVAAGVKAGLAGGAAPSGPSGPATAAAAAMTDLARIAHQATQTFARAFPAGMGPPRQAAQVAAAAGRTAGLSVQAELLARQRAALTAELDARTRLATQSRLLNTAPLDAKTAYLREQTLSATAGKDAMTRHMAASRELNTADTSAQVRFLDEVKNTSRAFLDAATKLMQAERKAASAVHDAKMEQLAEVRLNKMRPEVEQAEAIRAQRGVDLAGRDARRALDAERRLDRAERSGFTEAQRSAHERAGVMHAFGARAAGGYTSQVANVGAGLEQMGFAKGGAAVSRAAPALGIGLAGVDLAARAAVALQDPYMTERQQARSLARELPGGATAQRWFDAFTGRAAGMEMAQRRGEELTIRGTHDEQIAQAQAEREAALAGAGSRYRQLKEGAAVTLGAPPRVTAEQERAYREESRLLPLKRQLVKATREQAVANAELTTVEAKYGEAVRRGSAAEQQRLGLMRLKDDPNLQGGQARERVLQELRAKEEEIAANAQTQQQLAGQRAAAQNRAAAAGAQVGEARAGILRAEGQSLEERAARASGTATRLGMMGAGDRARNVAYLEVVRKAGADRFAYLPEEIRQGAAAVAPEYVGRLAEQAGAGTREYRRVQEVSPVDTGVRPGERATPAALREEAAFRETRAAKESHAAETEAARIGEMAAADLGPAIARAMQAMVEKLVRDLDTLRHLGRNQQ